MPIERKDAVMMFQRLRDMAQGEPKRGYNRRGIVMEAAHLADAGGEAIVAYELSHADVHEIVQMLEPPRPAQLSTAAQKDLDEMFTLRAEALKLLDLVIAEWSSDPQSVQCFDLRVVNRSKAVMKRIKELDAFAT